VEQSEKEPHGKKWVKIFVTPTIILFPIYLILKDDDPIEWKVLLGAGNS
jgi:hypothetical protein